MHICFVDRGYPHPHGGGGAGTYIQLVGKELVRRGHKVTVVTDYCEKCSSDYNDEGIHILRPDTRKNNLHWYTSKIPILKSLSLTIRYLEHGISLYSFLAELHKKEPVDLLEFNEGGDFWHAIFHRVPYISQLHGSRYTFLKMSRQPLEKGARLQRQFELFFIRRAAYVISPSEAMLQVVTQENGKAFKNKQVIFLPLDTTLLLDTLLNVHHTNVQLFFAGSNLPVKGGEVLLKAIPLVLDKFPDAIFHLFGIEPPLNSPSPKVFFHGFLPKKDLIDWYKQADICVIPSLWDNSPNTVYEAMAAGKPIVASKVGGIPELVTPETGILVTPGDPVDLADAILRLCQNEKLRSEMGKKAQQRIREKADLTENVDQRIKVYRKIVSRDL